jgi:hypothetical protein
MSETGVTEAIPKWKREWMYSVWTIDQNDTQVHRVCEVHRRTVQKYRKLDKGEERFALEVEGLVAAEPDKKLELATTEAIRQLTIVRGKALEAIMALKFTRPEHAWKAYREALDQEMQLRGAQPKTQINLIMIAAERFQDMQKPDPKDVTDEAQISEVN